MKAAAPDLLFQSIYLDFFLQADEKVLQPLQPRKHFEKLAF